MHKFAPAAVDEPIVFGAAKPRYTQVAEWIQFMQSQGMQRVCCLLPEFQLSRYANLLGTYRSEFGPDRLCWAPLDDFEIADRATLIEQILPFLTAADDQAERVVVHCAGGIGRTGQVLAAWLVYRRGYTNRGAIEKVRRSGRNPYEAVAAAVLRGRSPWQAAADLNQLLNECRSAGEKLRRS
jgi:protein-tyrosine phosphatase